MVQQHVFGHWVRIGIATATLFCGGIGSADEGNPSASVTFHKDILPIFQENCIVCHRQGGQNIAGMVAPFSLTNYQEVRPWAKGIERAVTSRVMPPWYASGESHGVFANERGLSEFEIALISRWVQSGAKSGNPSDAPAPLEFPDTDGWIIGKPDLEIKFDEPYFVEDDVEDHYANFTVTITDEQLPKDRWLRAIEWRPDAKSVHHIVGYQLFVDENGKQQRHGLGSIAPGEEPHIFPPGYGKKLEKGAKILFSMHYHKEPGEGTGEWDQSSVGFRFWDEEQDPAVQHSMIWDGIVNFRFQIPPGDPNYEIRADMTFDEDTTILSLHPHMHLRGKNARYIAHYPDGKQEQMLHVPNWNFDWQLDYTFREPKQVPAGTRVEYIATFDNSTENESNPDPTKAIRFGQATTDEMMIGFIHYTSTAPIKPETSNEKTD